MKAVKDLVKKLAGKGNLLGFKEWLVSLNRIKITAIIAVNCFLLTGVYGQTIAGVLEKERATEQFKQVFEDMDVPYSYGKITAGKYEGSDRVVINIQDLHNHAEVQKNISNIIRIFDEKYGVKRVYVEGAYGQVSTKWLTVTKDKKVKDMVIETLLKTGRLTGAEYYSAIENKAEIIKGLEKKEEYFDNLKRLGTIIENQETVTMHIEAIKETVKELQKKYYNKQQKQIEELSKQYVSGKEPAKKYFAKMKRYAQELAIDTKAYENLSKYMELLDKQKKIDSKRASQELQMFILNIKKNVPYSVYSKLLSMTNNFKQIDKLYGYLIRLSREYDLKLAKNYKELEKLFEYIELSQSINPLELVKEEQNFKDELNDRFSVNKVEQEVIFLSNFIKYYEDYLSGKITANDCKYYNNNIDKFKYVWVKYIDNREIVALEEYEKISDEFYKINMARNEYFMENMKEILSSNKIEAEVKGEDEVQKSMNSLKQAKEIYITVTGGFHTQELSKMLSEAGITNIIITPNVTRGVKEAQKTYYEIAKEQAKIAYQALSTLVTSSMPNIDKIIEFFKVAQENQISKTEMEKSVKELVIEFNKEQRIKKGREIKVEIPTEKEIIINDKKYRYEGNKVIEEGIKPELNKSMQKSVKSVKETIKTTVLISVGLSIITIALIPISIFTGSFPIVAMIVGESITAIGAVFSWMTVIFKNKQISLLNNKRAKEIKEKISINKIMESDVVSEEIKNKIKDKFIELGFKEEEIGTPDKELGENEFAEVEKVKGEKKGFVHINYSLIQELFMNGTEFKEDVISNAYLTMFIVHELRHRNNPGWSEWQVSFFDIFSFIYAYIKEIIKGSNIEGKKKKVVEKLKEQTEGNIKEEDLNNALEGKKESYKKEVIGLLGKFFENGGEIVNCAVKSLKTVINAQSIWQVAIQTLLTEISLGLFVKNNEKNIKAGNTKIKTSMLAMKEIMRQEGYEAEGYETDVTTFMENLREGESAIVWVNKNHYITVTKLEAEKYSIVDSNVNKGEEIIYATKLLLHGESIILQSGEHVRYKTKDGKIKVLSASEGLKEAQGNIRKLSEKEMKEITGAEEEDIIIQNVSFKDKGDRTYVTITYQNRLEYRAKQKIFQYEKKLTTKEQQKERNRFKMYGMPYSWEIKKHGKQIPVIEYENSNDEKIEYASKERTSNSLLGDNKEVNMKQENQKKTKRDRVRDISDKIRNKNRKREKSPREKLKLLLDNEGHKKENNKNNKENQQLVDNVFEIIENMEINNIDDLRDDEKEQIKEYFEQKDEDNRIETIDNIEIGEEKTISNNKRFSFRPDYFEKSVQNDEDMKDEKINDQNLKENNPFYYSHSDNINFSFNGNLENFSQKEEDIKEEKIKEQNPKENNQFYYSNSDDLNFSFKNSFKKSSLLFFENENSVNESSLPVFGEVDKDIYERNKENPKENNQFYYSNSDNLRNSIVHSNKGNIIKTENDNLFEILENVEIKDEKELNKNNEKQLNKNKKLKELLETEYNKIEENTILDNKRFSINDDLEKFSQNSNLSSFSKVDETNNPFEIFDDTNVIEVEKNDNPFEIFDDTNVIEVERNDNSLIEFENKDNNKKLKPIIEDDEEYIDSEDNKEVESLDNMLNFDKDEMINDIDLKQLLKKDEESEKYNNKTYTSEKDNKDIEALNNLINETEVIEFLKSKGKDNNVDEDFYKAVEGKEESYKNEVIGLLNKFFKDGGEIVNCAVQGLKEVINTQTLEQIALQTLLTEISLGLFVKNNEKNIKEGNTKLNTSMSTMKEIMSKKGHNNVEGYSAKNIEVFINNLSEKEKAIVWVNGNHYIVIEKKGADNYQITDKTNEIKESVNGQELKNLLEGTSGFFNYPNGHIYMKAINSDNTIKFLSEDTTLNNKVLFNYDEISELTDEEMAEISGAGGYKKDIDINDAKFYDKKGVTYVKIMYVKKGEYIGREREFKYKELLTESVKIKIRNHYIKNGMTDYEWINSNGLDIPNMKQQIKKINKKKVMGIGKINKNLKQTEHKKITKINDKRIIINVEKNDKKDEKKINIIKNKVHNVDINQNINEVNKKNEVNKNQSNSNDKNNKLNIKKDKIENSNNKNDDNYIKQLKEVNNLLNEQLSLLKSKSIKRETVVINNQEAIGINNFLKVFLQKNSEIRNIKSNLQILRNTVVRNTVDYLEQKIGIKDVLITLPYDRLIFVKNIVNEELNKYNQDNQNNIKPKTNQVSNNGKNISNNVREFENVKHNDLNNKVYNNIRKDNINKILDKNKPVKDINANSNINIEKNNNKQETNNVKKDVEKNKNKINYINKEANNVATKSSVTGVNGIKETNIIDKSKISGIKELEKDKYSSGYIEDLQKLFNCLNDNNLSKDNNTGNIILLKTKAIEIKDLLYKFVFDYVTVLSNKYREYYDYMIIQIYYANAKKNDKVELSKEEIDEIKQIVKEELEKQNKKNNSNQNKDTGVKDNNRERDINQQKNKEVRNIEDKNINTGNIETIKNKKNKKYKDNNIEIENNNRNKDIKQEKQNIVLNNKKVKSLITMINNILKRNNQYISIQDTIKIIRALNCIDDIEQNLKDSLKKYIDNINNVLENARNNPVIDINSIKLNEIKELLETGINNKSTGKKVININNDMNNLKEQKELINRIKNNRLPEKQNDKNINTNGKKTLKKLNYNVVCTFEELKNLNNLNKLNKTYYQPTELIWIKNGKIEIKDKEKIKNVYLDFTNETMVYDNTNEIYNFYENNKELLEKFKTDNDIDLEDFFVHMALNRAILEFIKSGIEYENNNLSAEQEEKLKEYFFSNLFSILKKGDNYYFIKKFSVVNYGDKNKTNTKFLIYNNYFFKIKDFGVESRSLKNEYDAYNKIKENQNLKGNINEYYCLFNKNFENKKHKVIVSKNLIKDGFMDLHDFLTKNKVKYDQSIKIIKEVLNIQQNLENKKLYNFDLKPANIMVREDKSKGTFEIKLIDYEGIAPEGSTCLVSTYRLAYDNCFLADKDLRSAYNDYIKFIFILNVLYGSYGINKENERIYGTLYKLAVNDDIRKAKDTKSIKLLEDFIYGLDYFYKNINNFDEQFGDLNLDKDYFKRIKNLLEISLNLVEQRDGQSAKNIIVLKEKKLDSNAVTNAVKRKIIHKNDGILILAYKNIIIDRSNKIVPIWNNKFIKKREKGEFFAPVNWYFNINKKTFEYDPEYDLSVVFEELQEKGNDLQTIVDELIPIDDTNMIQRVVLGTLMAKFIAENKNKYLKDICTDLNKNFDKYKNKYFNKDYFKKIFMQIIEKADKTLLGAFFDFKKECKVIKNKGNNELILKFNCSNLFFNLSAKDLNVIEKKFGKVTIYTEKTNDVIKFEIQEGQKNRAAFLGKKINNLFAKEDKTKGEEEISEANKSIFSKVKEVTEESAEKIKTVYEDIENKILKFVDKLNILKDSEEKEKTDIISRMNKLTGEKIERIKIGNGEVTIAGFDSAELQSDIEKKGEEYRINYRMTEEFLEVLGKVKKIIGEKYFNELLKEIAEHEKAENLYKIEFREQYQERYKGEEDIIEQGERYETWEYNLGRDAHEFAMETAGDIQRTISKNFENIKGLINLEKRLKKKGNSLTTKEAEDVRNIISEILTDMSEYGVNIEKIYKTFPNIKEEIIAKYNGETAGKDISEATKEQSIGKKICAIPIKILKDKEGKILKDEKGKDIQVKVSIRYNEKEKTLQMSYIGKSKETIEKYIAEGVITREDIEKVAEVLFIDRLMTDFIVREKYEKYSGEKIDRYNEGLIEEQKAMLKEIGYSDLEINELLSYATTTNTYVGIKDATLTISKSIKDIGNILLVYKRAGVSKVVLVKGEGIQEFDEKVINQISKAGLHPIIGITKDSTKREIEKYEKIKSVYGYRALISKEYNQEQIKETVEKIKNSKKEISYKMEDNKAIAEIDKMLNAKAICVLDTKNMGVSKNKELIISGEEINANTKEFIKAIAEQGRVSLYFDSDGDENIEKANKLVEKIFGKGLNSAKTMISLGKTYINSQFGQLLKKNVATIYFSKGYEKGYEELFEDKTADKVAQSLNKLLSGEKTYDSFKKEYEQGNYNEIMTNEFKEEILNVEKQEKFSKEEKAVVIRQMVIGSMVSYVEKRIISKYCDINTTDIKVKNQIADRILSLICNGYNIEDIEKELTKEEITINDKLSELVREILNGERAKDISERWNKTDVRLKVYADNNVIEDIKEIRILLEDNLKPIDREENRIAENVLDVTKMLLQAA